MAIEPVVDLNAALQDIDDFDAAAAIVLYNKALKEAIMNALAMEIKTEFQTVLKDSKLIRKNERDYLLSINPTDLCMEFKNGCPNAFQILTKGRLQNKMKP